MEEKQLYRSFKRLISNISHEKNLDMAKKRKLKRETESLLIAAQNNAIRTNHIKERIDKMQQNSKCRLCGNRDETINHIKLKKLWNMKVTIIPIVIGAFGTVTKGLLKGLEDLEVGGRVETIQTTTLLGTARILNRVQET